MGNIDDLLKNICEMINTYKVEHLNLEENETSKTSMLKFLQFLKKYKIESLLGLDLSYNEKLQDLSSLGKIVESFKIRELKLVGCGMDTEKLIQLQSGISDSQIEKLDLSYNIDLECEDIIILPGMLKHDKIKSLKLCGCDLDEDDVEGFLRCEFDNLQIRSLDLSYNPNLGCEGISIVGETIRKMECEDLSLSGCSLDEECIKSLRISLNKHKMNDIDISDNPKLGQHLEEVVRLIKESVIENVKLSDCLFTSKQLLGLSEQFEKQNVKVKQLDLSDSIRIPDLEYVSSISKILPFVENEIIVCFPNEHGGKMQESLQSRLNQIKKKSQHITYQYVDACNIEFEGIEIIGEKGDGKRKKQ